MAPLSTADGASAIIVNMFSVLLKVIKKCIVRANESEQECLHMGQYSRCKCLVWALGQLSQTDALFSEMGSQLLVIPKVADLMFFPLGLTSETDAAPKESRDTLIATEASALLVLFNLNCEQQPGKFSYTRMYCCIILQACTGLSAVHGNSNCIVLSARYRAPSLWRSRKCVPAVAFHRPIYVARMPTYGSVLMQVSGLLNTPPLRLPSTEAEM